MVMLLLLVKDFLVFFLPIVFRVWASARMVQLEGLVSSLGFLILSSVMGVGRASVEAWKTSSLDIEEVFAGATDSHLFVADVVKSFDTVDRGILDRVLSSLGFAWLVSSCLF